MTAHIAVNDVLAPPAAGTPSSMPQLTSAADPVGDRRPRDLLHAAPGDEPDVAGLEPQIARVARADEAGERLGRKRS